MFRIIIPYFSSLLLLILWWSMFTNSQYLIAFNIFLILLIILTARVIFQNYFWSRYLLWFSLIISFLGQLLFLTLMTSNTLRYLLAFFLAFLWLLVWFFIKKYFDNFKEIHNTEYLEFNKFFYYLSFYFLISSLYSLIIFIDLNLFLATFLVFIASFIYTKEISSSLLDLDKKFLYFVIFLMIQLFIILYYLPVSFYLAGTIFISYYFFLIDFNIKKAQNFKNYFLIFFFSITLLLITSILKY